MTNIKKRNDVRLLKYKVLERIFYKSQSRKDLIDHFEIRPNTITNIIKELKDDGKIIENKFIQTGGRPLTQFKLNNNFKYYGGVLIEGERIQGTVIGYAGGVIYSCFRENSQDISAQALIENIKYVIEDLVLHTPDRELRKVHICGEYFSDDGRYFSTGYLENMEPINVLAKVSGEFDINFSTGSGIDAVILAERVFGKGRDLDEFLYVHFGSGIIVGIVGGKIGLKSRQTIVGELGHTRSFSNKQCRCGRTGCLETVASVWAIKDYLKENPDLLTRDQLNHLDNLPVSDILKMYLEFCLINKNQKVIKHLHYMSKALGVAIRNSLDIVMPRPVILSGSMIAAADIIIPEIVKEISVNTSPFEKQPIPVIVSELDMYAPSVGAAATLLLNEIASM